MRTAYRALTAAALTLAPVAAEAHNFAKGTFFPQVIEGIGASINSPVALMTLIPVGLLASIWQTEGMLRIWPGLLAGLVAGIFLAIFANPALAILALAAGVVCALLAVIARPWPPAVPIGAAFIAGALTDMVTLEGHGFGELPLGIYAGIVIGANAIAVIAAGIAKVLLEKFPYFWVRLAFRIVVSWTAAITLMYLTFQVKGVMGG